MDPTNHQCPSDVTPMRFTDWRPSKAVYCGIHNNNMYRQYMQRQGSLVMAQNLQNYVRQMNCRCEMKNCGSIVKPFDSSHLNTLERCALPPVINKFM